MLTTIPFNSEFDLDAWVGQRSFSFVFQRLDGATGERLGSLTPIRSGTLSHDTTRTIKRQLNLNLGVADTAAINPLVDRIDLFMKSASGTLWPLGRYMFTDNTETIFSSGDLSNVVLNDEMFLVDQQIIVGVDAAGQAISNVAREILEDLDIATDIEPSPFSSAQAWPAGTMRGQVLEALATTGDYFSPWFDNSDTFRMIRSFDPAMVVPQFDLDAGNQVIRNSITKTSNLLTAPNRFLVISNSGTDQGPVFATATVPPTAPHSFANRGFYITQTTTSQLVDVAQASAMANNLANRFTIFETVQLDTALDPRHDSYDVINWQGDLWLELGWSMSLSPQGTMRHVMRKAYMP